jgi:hypothetical protein
MKKFMFRLSERLGSRRHKNGNILAVLAMPVVPFAMAAPLSFENPFILEMEQSIDPFSALNKNISAFSAIASTGPPFGHKLFPAKGKTPIASISCNQVYCCTIKEHKLTVISG